MKSSQDKQGGHVMDLVLLAVATFLLGFTACVLIVFYKTGSEPSTLVASVFAFCGCEAGILGWIKTNKDKTASTSSATASEAVAPLVDADEPDDVGI